MSAAARYDVIVQDGYAYVSYWDDGAVVLDVGAGNGTEMSSFRAIKLMICSASNDETMPLPLTSGKFEPLLMAGNPNSGPLRPTKLIT